jgi:hypothetical protein
MFYANMPSPGVFIKSLDLRKSAAAVISALEINPSEESALSLEEFFTYCSKASAMANPNKPLPVAPALKGK